MSESYLTQRQATLRVACFIVLVAVVGQVGFHRIEFLLALVVWFILLFVWPQRLRF